MRRPPPMLSASRLEHRMQLWYALALGVVVLNTFLAYINLRRLDALQDQPTIERSALVNRAVGFQAIAGVCSVALLAWVVERVLREQHARRSLRDLDERHSTTQTGVPDGVVGLLADRVPESPNAALGAVLDALPTQVALLDRGGTIVAINAAWRRFAEMAGPGQRACSIGKNYPEACREQGADGADVAAGIMAVVSGQRPSFTTAHHCGGQPPLWLQMHVAPLDGQGSVCAVVAHEDVSERVRSQSRMERQSDQLRRLADVANLVNAAQDVRSVLGLVTAGACEIIGADHAVTHVVVGGANGLEVNVESGGATSGLSGTRVRPASWRDAPCGALSRTTRLTGQQLSADPEWRAFLRESDSRDVAGGWLGTPLVGRDGRHLGVLHLTSRATGFTDQDESILTQMARLAAGAIENAWLYEELREGDRRKDEFLATLAHELRNPLAPMRNTIEIIKRADDPSPRGEAIAVLERQLRQMVRLIDDLLDISRITKGKLDLRVERVDLGTVIRDAAEFSRPAIDAGGHQLVLALPLEPVVVQADHARLSQVFSNLLNNAAKYSDPGGRIEVTLEHSALDTIVRVRDSGVGISPEMLPRVFDMFVQEDQSLARARGGLGIGLTLVRSIVELHGGRVAAASEGAGLGSCFTVRLPRLVARAPNGESAPSAGDSTVSPVGQACRILVVDDNADAVDSLALLLGLEGHDVRVARDGPSAVEAARSFTPDVVLLDIGLPGMSGYDVARMLRSDARTARCLLVALTGWGQDADRNRSRDAGFDKHLVKPLDIQTLNSVLSQGTHLV